MYKYSLSTCTDKAPLISATQHLLSKAWATVCCFTARLGISLHKFGASSDKVLPCNHLSNQNLVDFPLPTMVSTATLKSVLVYRGTWIGKPVQECDVSVFRAQNHQTQSALPRASRLWIPRPSYCRRCWTCSQDTRQFPPFAFSWPCQRNPHAPSINCLDHQFR